MTTAVLSEVATIHGGGRLGLSGNDFAEEATVPAYGAAGLNGYLDVAEYADQSAIILSSIGARCGKCFLVQGAWTSLANTQVILPDPDRVDPTFLWYQLNDESRWHRSGSAQPFIKPSDVKSHRIYLPPLAEQRRIAAILDHADALRTKRRQVVTHLDTLAQSIFHNMFGDLRTSRWERVPFGELVPKVDNGTSPNCEARPAGPGEWGVLKLGAVTYGEFRPDANKAYLGDLNGMASNEVASGDVLMTRKNTRDLVGAVALVDETRPRLLLPDLIFRLHLDTKRLDRRYFQALMMNPQKRHSVRALSSGSASSMPNISKARLAKLPIELPPLALQAEFASQVESIGIQRGRVETAASLDDELLASLQARAFQGTL